MKILNNRVLGALASGALASISLSSVGLAQAAATPSSTGPASGSDRTVLLDVFHVTSTETSAYGAESANGAGRIALSLLDTSESVSVITKDFIGDIGGTSLLDATRFTASTTEGQFANRLDRLTMRGFQQDPAQQSQYIDGFRYSAVSAGFNQDPANLERVEIIKGPNAILAAAASPGGAMNFVTKSPQFTPGGYVKAEVGQYLADRGEIDLTGPLPWGNGKAMAYRIVAAYADSDGYLGNQFDRHYFVAPSYTWQIDPSTQVTIKGVLSQSSVPGLVLPVDPREGVNDPVMLYPGLSARSPQGGPASQGGFVGNRQSISIEATHAFDQHFQMRFGEMAIAGHLNPTGGNISGITSQTGNVNPYTGYYTPGSTGRL